MVPRNAPKTILVASLFQVSKKGATASYKFEIFGATRAILGVILDTAGRQGDPQIDSFGTRMRQNLKKWHPEWGIRKSLIFWLNFYQKMWDFEGAEPFQMLYI